MSAAPMLLPVLGLGMAIYDIFNPPVTTPAAPGTEPTDQDKVTCERHPPMPDTYIAQGSSKVFINGQPAARAGDKTTCDATIDSDTNVSPNVRIGGEPLTVRDIRNGKSKIAQFTGMVAGMLISRKIKLRPRPKGSPKPQPRIRPCKGSPVIVSTGSKVLGGPEDLDFTLPGLLPIEWARGYDSNDLRSDGLFGMGWSVPYEVEILRVPHPEGGELWIYVDKEGTRLELGRLKAGNAFVSVFDGLAFFQLEDGQTVVEDIYTGLYQVFQNDPHNPKRSRLIKLGDRNLNTLGLLYDKTGRLHYVCDGLSQTTLRLSYGTQHPKRVNQVERLYIKLGEAPQIEHTEVLASYRYTQTGQLQEVLDATGQVLRRFTYTAHGYLDSHTLPSGATRQYQWQRFEVPAQRPQSVRADGSLYKFPPLLEPQPSHEWRVIRHWGSDGEDYRFEYDLKKGETRVTDSLGRQDHYHWGPFYEIYKHIDPMGHCWQEDVLSGQLLKSIDPQGGEWQYGYDELGRLIETRDPLGRCERIRYTRHWALPLSITDGAGRTQRFGYDSQGNLLWEQDPLGRRTQYRYDSQGQVQCITDPLDKHKYLRWNAHGQLLNYRDCSNNETHYRYDRRGQLSDAINARGEHTHYRYDTRGYLIESQRPDGRIDRYDIDVAGQLTAYTDPAKRITRLRYDRSGRLIQRLDARGHTVEFGYDAYGRLLHLSNENRERYRFEWDVLDRLLAQQDLDGSGRIYQYDPLGDVTGIRHIPAPLAEPELDGKDSAEPNTLMEHRFERDALGRLIRKHTDDGVTEYSYDNADNLLAIRFTDNQGDQQRLDYTYDALGQLISETNSAGLLQYQYDELGNLQTLTLPDQRQLNHLYYGSGHLHQINLGGRVISDFERDALYDEVLRTQGALHTRTRYDRNGRLSQKALHYQQVAREVLPLLQKDYQYDPAGNLFDGNQANGLIKLNRRMCIRTSQRFEDEAKQRSRHPRHMLTDARAQPALRRVVVMYAAPDHRQFRGFNRERRVLGAQHGAFGQGTGGVVGHCRDDLRARQECAQAAELRHCQHHPARPADAGQVKVDIAAQVPRKRHHRVGPRAVVIQCQRRRAVVAAQYLAGNVPQLLALGIGRQFGGVADAHGNLATGQQRRHQQVIGAAHHHDDPRCLFAQLAEQRREQAELGIVGQADAKHCATGGRVEILGAADCA
ncbi:Cell wall-associated polypeptide CWBP200 [Pseudomonas sp. 58 R 3]|nr:Cell wall-associated polypeptide CWBP200 [Pseudomonas sp. 58 R 3]